MQICDLRMSNFILLLCARLPSQFLYLLFYLQCLVGLRCCRIGDRITITRSSQREIQISCCSSASSLLPDLGGDTVHIGVALLGEGLAHDDFSTVVRDVLDFAEDAGILEGVHQISDDLTSSESGVLGLGASSLLGSVVLSEGLDTDLSSHVDLVGDRGSAHVKPVVVIGTELLVESGLNVGSILYNIINLDFD